MPKFGGAARDDVPSSKVTVATDGYTTALASAWNMAKARIADLESAETVTVRRHKKLL